MSYKQKPIKEQELPLPEIIQKKKTSYDEKGLIYVETALDDEEKVFIDLVARRPTTHMRYVTYIMRVKTQKRFVVGDGETDEALIYHMKEEVQNHMGLYIPLHRDRGYWWDVDTRVTMNQQGQSAGAQVIGEFPVFQIPFSPENVEKIMDYSAIGVQAFHVAVAANNGPNILADNPFTIKNKADFVNGTFQELMDMGRYNYSTNESRLAEWRSEGQVIKKQSQTITALTGGANAKIPTRAASPP